MNNNSYNKAKSDKAIILYGSLSIAAIAILGIVKVLNYYVYAMPIFGNFFIKSPTRALALAMLIGWVAGITIFFLRKERYIAFMMIPPGILGLIVLIVGKIWILWFFPIAFIFSYRILARHMYKSYLIKKKDEENGNGSGAADQP